MTRYTLRKKLTISASHQLTGDIASEKCKQLHGHNWDITVTVVAKGLDPNGMVVDFGRIKGLIMPLDHGSLNSVLLQPTAENLARMILDGLKLDLLKSNPTITYINVAIAETEGNEVSYEENELS